jgi:hypothetical protein
MKRLLIIVSTFLLIFGTMNAQAASKMSATVTPLTSNTALMTIPCVANTDGTFDNFTISMADIAYVIQLEGYAITNAWAVNSATDDHISGAVTITDATGQVLIGTLAGDTLTLSTAAYNATTHAGVALLSIDRGSKQRTIISPITIEVSDTGSTAVVFTLYLLLSK